jgi:hypothetical protein
MVSTVSGRQKLLHDVLRAIYWPDVKREKLSNVLVLQRAYLLEWKLVHPLARRRRLPEWFKCHPSRTDPRYRAIVLDMLRSGHQRAHQ